MCASRGLKRAAVPNWPARQSVHNLALGSKKPTLKPQFLNEICDFGPVPILSVFPALIVHSELKSVHPGFPVAFIFKHKLIKK